ncbi:hypothetical protein V6N13_087291 [Hibiscus sabdariffa]
MKPSNWVAVTILPSLKASLVIALFVSPGPNKNIHVKIPDFKALSVNHAKKVQSHFLIKFIWYLFLVQQIVGCCHSLSGF